MSRRKILGQRVELLEKANAMMPEAAVVSVEDCRAFLTRAERMLPTRKKPADVEECRRFLRRVEQLVPDPVDLEACKGFLEEADQYTSQRWRRHMDRLRRADPRGQPDFHTVNLLKVFGISRKEAPHSRFLGWLLDPQETHGLGTSFLRSFLALAQRTCGCEFEPSLDGVSVELERSTDRGVPDITIVGSDFLCVIENKIMAAEGQDQTRRYAQTAMEEAEGRGIPDDQVLLLFLSPEGREPAHSRFHALSYCPVLQRMRRLRTEGAPQIVGAAISQFEFNLKAQVLHEYDREFEVLEHVEGYNARGDRYLRKHWRAISSLAKELKEVDDMTEFEGFSELSLLYAEKYHLVEAMEEVYDKECERLLQDLQNTVSDLPWFDPDRFKLYARGDRFELRLRNQVGEGILARIGVRLSPARLGRRELYSDIRLSAQPPDMTVVRERFREAAAKKLIEIVDVADYQASGRYLVRRRGVPFDVDSVLESMVEEVEKLRQLLPYVEEAYRDVTQGSA